MPDRDGYPTDDELKKVKQWDAINDPWGLIDFLEDIWNWPDWAITKKKGKTQIFRKPCLRLYISTGGWSGNESIISELQNNMFWMMFWVNSRRGGHYEFEIPFNWGKT